MFTHRQYDIIDKALGIMIGGIKVGQIALADPESEKVWLESQKKLLEEVEALKVTVLAEKVKVMVDNMVP